ncbi:MAG: NAD(P)H-hydrate dehydratase [Caldisericia bacterium]|nr:NAD(P)H-hydrate dehydratase [Caldisericia bacterium]
MYLQGSQDSHQLDLDAASKCNLSSLFLMNNAAKSVVNTILQHHKPLDGLVFLLAGPGNNGNDAIITGNQLHAAGFQVVLFLFLPERSAPSFAFLRENYPYPHFNLEDDDHFQTYTHQHKPRVVVDGLFGVGLSRPVPDFISKLCIFLNQLDPRPSVYSVDIPTGISADTGQILGEAIRADFTVTFDTLKNGHLLFPGKEFSGKVLVKKIGFPDNLIRENSHGFTFQNEDDFIKIGWLHLPKRSENSYKGSYGKAGIFGGSKMYPGALALCTESCLRVGTGLVYGFFPENESTYINPLLHQEVIRIPLSESSLKQPESVAVKLNPLRVFCIGPGLGRFSSYSTLMKYLLEVHPIPLLIDADGLFYVQSFLPLLKRKMVILTPHLGEMSLLTNLSTVEIQSDLLSVALHYASLWHVIIVLKSATTIVAHPDGRYYINPISQSALAKGGSGDVLTGIICGLLAQNTDPFWACILGVYLHSKAAQCASSKLSSVSVLPSDIILEINQIFLDWEKAQL